MKIKNKIEKLFLSLAMMVTLCMTLPISVVAAEEGSVASTNPGHHGMVSATEMVGKTVLPETIKVGDTFFVGQTDEGALYVEILDSQEMVTSPRSTIYGALQRTYLFYYKNLLGTRKDICKVNVVCDYEKNNNSVIITNLTGTYSNVGSDVSVSWDSSYTSASNTKHTLGLSYDAGFLKSGVIKFTATLGSVTAVDISCDTSLSYDIE